VPKFRRPQLRARFFAPASGPAIEKDRPVPLWMDVQIWKRDKGICQWCGCRCRSSGPSYKPDYDPKGNIDHIFPRSRGGRSTPENLQLLCQPCNIKKGAT
jgi:hypothetical protein